MKILIRVLLIFFALIALLLGASYIISGDQTEIVNTVQINKPPHEVFDYISDMRNELNWNPDVQYVDKKSAGPIETGTIYRAKRHLSDTIDVTVTQYYPPYWVTFENGGSLEATHRLELSKMGEETKLESKLIATPHGFIRSIFPFIKSQMKARAKENMINLKKTLESDG